MIASPDNTVVLSSFGWVDGDSLLCLDVESGQTRTIPLGTGARYASLHSDGSHLFAVGHHFDGTRFELSVRAFASPDLVVARAVVSETGRTITGDPEAWSRVPCLYPEYLSFPPYGDFVLVRMLHSGAVQIQPLDWFDDSYDKGYQGVVGALALPGGRYALMSVQRSSRLILHNLETGQQDRAVDLAGRGGGEAVALRNGGTELWAKDYDTVVVVDTEDWRVLRSTRLQKAAKDGGNQFIGAITPTTGSDEYLVARPFSGDVITIDSRSLTVTRRARVGREPLEAVMTHDGEVIARDWKTGDMLRGRLESPLRA